jgi:hypothetical protein
LCSAQCPFFLYPSDNDNCNSDPNTFALFESLVELADTDAGSGECEAAVAGWHDQANNWATLIYTGLDGVVSTAASVNTLELNYPSIVGTYTMQYNVPHTAIAAGSVVTVTAVWDEISNPAVSQDYGVTFTLNHISTILYTGVTSTITYPIQVFTGG